MDYILLYETEKNEKATTLFSNCFINFITDLGFLFPYNIRVVQTKAYIPLWINEFEERIEFGHVEVQLDEKLSKVIFSRAFLNDRHILNGDYLSKFLVLSELLENNNTKKDLISFSDVKPYLDEIKDIFHSISNSDEDKENKIKELEKIINNLSLQELYQPQEYKITFELLGHYADCLTSNNILECHEKEKLGQIFKTNRFLNCFFNLTQNKFQELLHQEELLLSFLIKDNDFLVASILLGQGIVTSFDATSVFEKIFSLINFKNINFEQLKELMKTARNPEAFTIFIKKIVNQNLIPENCKSEIVGLLQNRKNLLQIKQNDKEKIIDFFTNFVELENYFIKTLKNKSVKI